MSIEQLPLIIVIIYSVVTLISVLAVLPIRPKWEQVSRWLFPLALLVIAGGFPLLVWILNLPEGSTAGDCAVEFAGAVWPWVSLVAAVILLIPIFIEVVKKTGHGAPDAKLREHWPSSLALVITLMGAGVFGIQLLTVNPPGWPACVVL